MAKLLVKFEKYLLLFVNAIFEILGCALIASGLWLLCSPSYSDASISYVVHNAIFIPIALIVLGCVVCVISVLGFWGALRGSPCLLKTYAWILLFILFFKMWGAIFVAISTYKERAAAGNVTHVQMMFDRYGRDEGDTLFVNAIQNSFKCCGYDDPKSMVFENQTYPWSCCGSSPDIMTCLEPAYTEDCVSKISEVVAPVMMTVSIVYYTIVVVQILCIVIAFCLSSSLSKKTAKLSYYNL